MRHDIARRTVHQRGWTRYSAVCLLSGYAWLGVARLVLLAAGELAPGSRSYDAIVHALGMGFVFSMVFGHAPIILPAVWRVSVPYQPYFYGALTGLLVSLMLRLGGDALGAFTLVRAGGLLGVQALAGFIVGTAGAVIRGRR